MTAPMTTHRRAPWRVQALRVLVLARLLTVLSWSAALVGHLAMSGLAVTRHRPPFVGGWLIDVRLWASAFVAWVLVVAACRRTLRLDT